MQVIVLDPARDICRRAETLFTPTGPDLTSVTSSRPLAALLADGTADDVLVARISRDDDGVKVAQCVQNSRFSGTTVFVVERSEQLGLEQRLRVSRAESLAFSTPNIDSLLRRLAVTAATPSLAHPPRRERATFHGLVGRSKQILEVFARIEKAAAGDANVCIYGESGTGKELIARAIHEISERRDGPLITFDCTAVPEGLAESQLFGHVRGAFTGAIEHREGVFSQADNGTLFIDELCELSPPLQAKLLRVIQSREFTKVGGSKPIRTDIRLVTASNKDLRRAVEDGAFREDLYYRIAVVMLQTPPLRDRRGDVPVLIDHFLAKFSAAHKKRVRGVTPQAMELLTSYQWPGNVRQLENCIEQAVVLSEGEMVDVDVLWLGDAGTARGSDDLVRIPTGLPLRDVEQQYILRTLQETGGNRTRAARILGISLRCLQYKLKAYAEAAAAKPVQPNGSSEAHLLGV